MGGGEVAQRASPPITARAGQPRSGALFPSTSTSPIRSAASAPIARRMARKLAWRMLCTSISSTEATPSPTRAQPASAAASSSRRAAGTFLLSSRPSGMQPGSSITAAATTGPAQGPRPTSSTPQTGCAASSSIR